MKLLNSHFSQILLLLAYFQFIVVTGLTVKRSHKLSSGHKKHSQSQAGGQSNLNNTAGGQSTPNKLKITGGGNATAQTPANIADLKKWLSDDVPRVILIKATFDFSTQPQSNVTDTGCVPFAPCKNGNQVQEARDFNGWCSKYSRSHKPAQVSFHEAALQPLEVGSHKTLLGVGSDAVLQGKGLILLHSQNVIIRNIVISDLNPNIVWGGDAIMMDGASDILIEHCTFRLLGRQMIATGGMASSEANFNIFLMNNLFDGKTQWSARCSNRHYWNVLITGPGDTVTMGNNCFLSTSGRSPKLGGSGNPDVVVHYYNNLHTDILGETFEVASGSTLLAEGNVFQNAHFQNKGDKVTEHGGNSYVPFTEAQAQACQSVLGRACVQNLIDNSSPYQFGLREAALEAFVKHQPADLGPIQPASSIVNGVPGGCGAGHI